MLTVAESHPLCFLLVEVLYIFSKIHESWVHLDKCLHMYNPCNHHPDQDVLHFHMPRELLSSFPKNTLPPFSEILSPWFNFVYS